MDTCEVTQQEWQEVMGAHASWNSPNGGGKHVYEGKDTGRHPVEWISSFVAIEFCNKLSMKERGLTQRPYTNGADGFGSGQPGGMLVAMADGSVRFLPKDIDPEVLERLVTVSGGRGTAGASRRGRPAGPGHAGFTTKATGTDQTQAP